jgi:hypothetical protein
MLIKNNYIRRSLIADATLLLSCITHFSSRQDHVNKHIRVNPIPDIRPLEGR